VCGRYSAEQHSETAASRKRPPDATTGRQQSAGSLKRICCAAVNEEGNRQEGWYSSAEQTENDLTTASATDHFRKAGNATDADLYFSDDELHAMDVNREFVVLSAALLEQIHEKAVKLMASTATGMVACGICELDNEPAKICTTRLTNTLVKVRSVPNAFIVVSLCDI
jgi:hypothetical protein